ncbi:MAG TPA: AraC family transcriptional regulator ligand-binding domain-containing protein [Pseudoxanthomonas sp.]|nr:AraC family transcriptional regulator ligand-binding domain-containing protein [Pseudoxanthomonas sp.]
MDSVRGSALLDYNDVLQQRGACAQEYLSRFQVPADVVGRYERKLGYRRLAQLLNETARAIDMPHLGMELANRQGVRLIGPLRNLANTADTVGQGVAAVLDYLHLHSRAIRLSLLSPSDSARRLLVFESNLATGLALPQLVEKSLLHGCLLLREMTDNACQPKAVLLRHPPLSQAALYRHYFGCPVLFSQIDNAVVLDADDLARPCVQADPELHAIIRFYLDNHADTDAPGSLRVQMLQQMHALLPRHRCNLEQVAPALGMSVRTLQRRLKQAGMDFEDELDRMRRDLAEQLLLHSHLSVAQVAHELGYRCAASFSRAHQRWFGISPLMHRRCKERRRTLLPALS